MKEHDYDFAQPAGMCDLCGGQLLEACRGTVWDYEIVFTYCEDCVINTAPAT